MNVERGGHFSVEGTDNGGLPSPDDIHLCDAEVQLNDRVVEQESGSTTYDCKACFARLTDAGFANIVGELSCRSNWANRAKEVIRGE